jgi:hypothetical protein
MQKPNVTNIRDLSMCESGQLLAVFGNPGLQLFHFSGAAPITPYSAVLLPKVDVDEVAWDDDNHMHALSYETGRVARVHRDSDQHQRICRFTVHSQRSIWHP